MFTTLVTILIFIAWILAGTLNIIVMRTTDKIKIKYDRNGPYWMYDKDNWSNYVIPIISGLMCLPFTLLAAYEGYKLITVKAK